MKLKDIFETTHMELAKDSLGSDYWPKTMTFFDLQHMDQDPTQPPENPFGEIEGPDGLDKLKQYIEISNNDEISLKKDNTIIFTGEWEEMKDYLTQNWDDLYGHYSFTSGNRVIHRFKIS